MMVRIYAVYDKKAEAYLAPFTFPHDGQALRAFSDTVNDESTQFYRHADDFDLYSLGTFDQESGEFQNEKHFLAGARFVLEPVPDGPVGSLDEKERK